MGNPSEGYLLSIENRIAPGSEYFATLAQSTTPPVRSTRSNSDAHPTRYRSLVDLQLDLKNTVQPFFGEGRLRSSSGNASPKKSFLAKYEMTSKGSFIIIQLLTIIPITPGRTLHHRVTLLHPSPPLHLHLQLLLPPIHYHILIPRRQLHRLSMLNPFSPYFLRTRHLRKLYTITMQFARSPDPFLLRFWPRVCARLGLLLLCFTFAEEYEEGAG
jgi:hypothetical protein